VPRLAERRPNEQLGHASRNCESSRTFGGEARERRPTDRASGRQCNALPCSARSTTENVEGQLSVQISVKNFGTTPAKVTDILMKPIVLPNNQSLPKRPDYARVWGPILPQAFLVAQEEFFYDVAFNISPEQMAAVNNAFTHTLYLIGYVDYIDQFGQRHRGGYARMYKPLTGLLQHQDNLIYVVQEGYNYDRRRTRGEGEDWLREGSAF
jgi:hypothetical protein